MPRGYWAETYDLPHVGTTKRGELPIETGSFTTLVSAIGEGKISTAYRQANGDLLDLDMILDPVNNLGRLVKIMQGAAAGATERYAFRIDETSNPHIEAGQGPMIDVWGGGVEAYLDEATLPNFDDPAKPTLDPDHIFGARSIMSNGDLENNEITNAVHWLWFDPGTTGSFTLSDGVDTTSAITLPTDFTQIASRIETDLASIVDVYVEGTGTFEDKFRIEYIDPGQVAVPLLTIDDTNITAGGVFTTDGHTGGQPVSADPWYPSTHPQTGALHGEYDFFGPATDWVHGGMFSLKIISRGVGASDYSGAQQGLNVGGGRTYRDHAWVRSVNAATFVVAVRTLDETTVALTEVAVAANTDTLLVMPPFANLPHPEQLIFRIAIKSVGITETWWIDDAEFAPGLPAATAGFIAGHCLDRIQASGTPADNLSWLGRTFTDTTSSGGTPWVADESITLERGRSMRQVLDVLKGFNYDWLITPDGAGGYELNLYNPGEIGIDRSTTVRITSGEASLEQAQLRRLAPRSNRIHVEGENGIWEVLEDASKRAGFGQRDRYQVATNITDSVSLLAWADALLDEENARGVGSKVLLKDHDTLRVFEHFTFGDRVTVDFPPETSDIQRLRGATLTISKGRLSRAELHMEREVLNRAEIDAKAILRILSKFEAAPRPSIVGGASARPIKGFGNTSVYSLPGQAFLESGRLALVFGFDVEIHGVRLACNVAPTGAALIYDVHHGGSSIFLAAANRPTIPAGQTTGDETPLVHFVGAGGRITVDCDQVGSTIPGGDVTVMLRWVPV